MGAAYLLGRLCCYTHQIDAVSVSFSVRQVVAKVGAVHTDALTVGQTSHVLPVYLREKR